MEFRIGEINRGEIWENQINRIRQPSFIFYKATSYKFITFIISILTVVYPKETVFITVTYHYLVIPVSEDFIATAYLFPRTIFKDIKKFPAQRYQKESIQKFTISKILEEKISEKLEV